MRTRAEKSRFAQSGTSWCGFLVAVLRAGSFADLSDRPAVPDLPAFDAAAARGVAGRRRFLQMKIFFIDVMAKLSRPIQAKYFNREWAEIPFERTKAVL